MKAETIDWYENRYSHDLNGTAVTAATIQGMREFRKELNEIEEIHADRYPSTEDHYWTFWITISRGEPEPFDPEYDTEDDYQDYLEYWNDMYPDEEYWYKVFVHEYRNWLLVQIGEGKWSLSVDTEKPADWGLDCTELFSFLKKEVIRVKQELRDGTCNSHVEENLPVKYRTGSILRRDYYEIFPDCREAMRDGLTEKEINRFLKIYEERKSGYRPDLLQNVSAGDFYKVCSNLYLTSPNEYPEAKDLTPKEMYLHYADGRDEGMRDLPEDSAESFAAWLADDSHSGGHPWEITHTMSIEFSVHCYVNTGRNLLSLDELAEGKEAPAGYYYAIRGTAIHRTRQIVRFFLALYDQGYPIFLYDMDTIAGRLMETDRIGIKPCTVNTWGPNYDSKYADVTNLPDEPKEAALVAAKTTWEPLESISLSNSGPAPGQR